jgi:glucose/mannose transport system permease protein
MSQKRKERLITLALLVPSVVAIGVFVYGFVGWTVRVSLSQWRGVVPDYTFVGLSNYTDLFQMDRFQTNLWNTALFTVAFIGLCLVLGLGLAVLLDQKLRGETVFRTIYLLPMAVSFVVTGVVWRWLLNPVTEGARLTGLNLLLHRVGLGALASPWHMHPRWGMLAIALAATWQLAGYVMALYLAGIRGIPEEMREAARVDGASEWQIYRRVVLPLLRPVTLGAVVILGHISLKIFDLVMAISPEGGLGYSAEVPAMHMWFTTFRGLRFGRGAAIAVILFVLVSLLVIPYLRYSLRREAER